MDTSEVDISAENLVITLVCRQENGIYGSSADP